MRFPCSFVDSVVSKGAIKFGLNKLDVAPKLLAESNGAFKDDDAVCIFKRSIIDQDK